SRRLPTRRWIGKEAGGCVAGSARHAEAAPAEAWSTLGEVDLRVVGYARRQGIFRVHLHASGRPSEDFTSGVPPSLKLANSVGLRTRSGTEDRPPCNPHLALETTSWTPLPPNMAEK